MTLDEIIKDVRSELNDPVNGGIITDFELAAWANRGQDLLASKIMEADQNFFEESDQTLAFVANQEEYALPAAIWNRKITLVTRTDLSSPKPLTKIRFQEKELYSSASAANFGSGADGDVYYLRNNFIGLKPTPKSTYAPVAGVGNILVNYLRLPHEMHYSDAGSPTSTTLIVPVNTVGSPRMRAGRVNTTPNYYIGARLRFITPGYLSYGQETVVTAFNVNTRVMTFSPAINFSDVVCGLVYVQYVLLSPIPVEYHDIIFQFVVMRGSKKKGDGARSAEAKDMLRTLLDNLVNTIEPRAYDENQHVRPPVDQNFD